MRISSTRALAWTQLAHGKQTNTQTQRFLHTYTFTHPHQFPHPTAFLWSVILRQSTFVVVPVFVVAGVLCWVGQFFEYRRALQRDVPHLHQNRFLSVKNHLIETRNSIGFHCYFLTLRLSGSRRGHRTAIIFGVWVRWGAECGCRTHVFGGCLCGLGEERTGGGEKSSGPSGRTIWESWVTLPSGSAWAESSGFDGETR